MESKHCYTLQIDREFRNLIRPLHRAEYLQLEANIMSDGCRDPIITWQGVIIDGHNRYEICHRHDIPFAVEEMEFSCREEAIDRVSAIIPSPALKAGGQGDRYTIWVNGKPTYLFFERSTTLNGDNIGRWFVERRVN